MRSVNHKAYRHRLSERLGILPASLKSGGIVIHGASVGEVIALKPLIESCLAQFSDMPITVTTFTPTGSEQVTRLFGDRVQHCYLPLDIMPCTASFLGKLDPRILVIMETELWPNLVSQAHKRGTKLLLVNGRISDKSISSYKKFSALVKPCLQRFDHIFAQNPENQERFVRLGADAKKCTNGGNLKFDLSATSNETKQAELAAILPKNRPVIMVASSHQGDEELGFQAFKEVLRKLPDALLAVVPRHPERFDTVFQLSKAHEFTTQRRSESLPVGEQTNVWIMDSLGEMMAAFPLADLVVMGGSFSTIGGHNPLEPAVFRRPIITGGDMANFDEIHQQLLNQQGIITLTADSSNTAVADQLAEQALKLLTDTEFAKQLGNNAYQVVASNKGATQRSVETINELVNQ